MQDSPNPPRRMQFWSDQTWRNTPRTRTTLEHSITLKPIRPQIWAQCSRFDELENYGLHQIGTNTAPSDDSAGGAVVFSMSGECLLFNLGEFAVCSLDGRPNCWVSRHHICNSYLKYSPTISEVHTIFEDSHLDKVQLIWLPAHWGVPINETANSEIN